MSSPSSTDDSNNDGRCSSSWLPKIYSTIDEVENDVRRQLTGVSVELLVELFRYLADASLVAFFVANYFVWRHKGEPAISPIIPKHKALKFTFFVGPLERRKHTVSLETDGSVY